MTRNWQNLILIPMSIQNKFNALIAAGEFLPQEANVLL
jgi:hypothetical protein